MKFWPFPIVRNYEENACLTALFLMFAKSKNLKIIARDRHYIVVKTEHGTLKFWSANMFYAWASDGEYQAIDGRRQKWFSVMPSRYAVRVMRKALRHRLVEGAA